MCIRHQRNIFNLLVFFQLTSVHVRFITRSPILFCVTIYFPHLPISSMLSLAFLVCFQHAQSPWILEITKETLSEFKKRVNGGGSRRAGLPSGSSSGGGRSRCSRSTVGRKQRGHSGWAHQWRLANTANAPSSALRSRGRFPIVSQFFRALHGGKFRNCFSN